MELGGEDEVLEAVAGGVAPDHVLGLLPLDGVAVDSVVAQTLLVHRLLQLKQNGKTFKMGTRVSIEACRRSRDQGKELVFIKGKKAIEDS